MLDRLLYDSFDPFASLAAAAAVTERIRLATMIAIGPLRPAATLIKDAASVQALSQGRLTLGLAIGARDDDYDACGVPTEGRGARLSDQLAELRDWDVSPVVPGTIRTGGRELLVGGMQRRRAFARMARYGDGYAHGGGPPRASRAPPPRRCAAWSDLGRPGAAGAVGPGLLRARGRREPARRTCCDYYAFTGPVRRPRSPPATSPRRARSATSCARYEEAGCDELVLLPTVADLGQLERLAEVLSREDDTSSAPGPSGLYLAILLKKADPRHEVVVVERNPPDATFGFGVVFSEETLGRLRDADEPTFTAITDAFATWTTIDVHFGGEVIRSRRPRLLRHPAHGAARHPAGPRAASWASSCVFEREVGELPSCRRPTCSSAPTGSTALRAALGAAAFGAAHGRLPDALRLVRHRRRARRVHLRVRRDRARRLPGARLSVRRAHEHVHRRDARGHVAAGRAGRRVGGGEPRVLPASCSRDVLDGHELLSNRSVWLAFIELRCKRLAARARRC